jgi:hypothetical protein
VTKLLCVILLFAAAGSAQPARENWDNLNVLAPGTEIRVTQADGKTIRGIFEKVTADAIVTQGGAFPRDGVKRVQFKRGRRGRNTLLGLGIGAGIGLATGAALDAKAGDDGFAISAKIALTGAGAIIGTLVGVGRPNWHEIYRARQSHW